VPHWQDSTVETTTTTTLVLEMGNSAIKRCIELKTYTCLMNFLYIS
jgi:hypothetical protein